MPRDLDEIEDLKPDSSTGGDAVDTAPDSAAKTSAASSTATDDKGSDGLLSVVRDVVQESRKPEPAASSAEGDEETGPQPGDRKEPPEDYSDVPFHKHPRFQQILREKKALSGDAERYRNVQRFLDDNGVEGQEAVNALEIAALRKTDPAACWARLKPWVQDLLRDAGEVLPDDLQQRVQAGELSQEAAFEVSRSRATVQSVEQQRSFEQQRREREQAQSAVQAAVDAATEWENDRRSKDPNFDAKYVPLQKEVLFLQQTEGRPTTPDGVRDQLQRAYKAVNANLVPIAPVAAPVQAVKPAIRPVQGGRVAQAQPAPTSILEIVQRRGRTG